MDTRNFVSARSVRRQIMHELQEQQRRDSQCSENLRHIIARHTRAILNIISDLLMSFENGNITVQDRQFLEKFSSQQIEGWLKQREAEADAGKSLSRVRSSLSSAESEYNRLAPLGQMVSGWFSDEREKAQIIVAKQNRDALRRECQQAESKHQSEVERIRSYAERFLRDAMTPVGINALLESPRVSVKLRSALDALNREVTETWRNHTNAQSESLTKVSSATADLRQMYQMQRTNAPTPLLGATNAATRN